MCIVINKRKHWLWRAVDQEGYALDILLQSRRNQKAAKKKLLPSTEHRQRFLSVHGQVYNLFRAWRYKNAANDSRSILKNAFKTWNQIALQATCA
jgi:transposase-like protein